MAGRQCFLKSWCFDNLGATFDAINVISLRVLQMLMGNL